MKNGRWTIWMLSVWSFAGLLLVFFQKPLFDQLWLGVAFVDLGFLAAGLFLACGIGVFAGVKKNWIAWLVCAGFPAIGIVLYNVHEPIAAYGEKVVLDYRFTSNRPAYDRIVSQVVSNPSTAGFQEQDSIRYQVDLGPPRRIAFPQPGGLLDNWVGIIYDPTGEVLKAKGWAKEGSEFTAPPEILGLFGGNMVYCVHVAEHYYRCSFT